MYDLKCQMLTYFILALLFSESIYSQTADSLTSQDIFDMSLEEMMQVQVISASKKMEFLSDAPASIIVITANQILERGYQNIEDVLWWNRADHVVGH